MTSTRGGRNLSTLLSAVSLIGLACVPVGAAEPLKGTITVDGSTTLYPLSQTMAEALRAANPDLTVNVKFSGTGGGFRKFCAGEIDVENASRPIKSDENDQCRANHIDYIEIQIAFDAVVVVVNPKNVAVDCLTVEELKKIWEPAAQGRITSWQQVRSGFPAEKLVLFGPTRDDGTFDYFSHAIVGTETESRTDYTANVDAAILAKSVAEDQNALGYFGNTYYRAYAGQLKSVAIDNGRGCVAPKAETVENGSYRPLSRPLLLYINAASEARREVEMFARSFLVPEAAQPISAMGYVALPAASLRVQNARLNFKVTGSAFGGIGSVIGVPFGWFSKTH